MKRLFEIVTDHIGESYVRSYAWADSPEDAERLFRESFPALEVMRVNPLFWQHAGTFVTNPSDTGWETSQELAAILTLKPNERDVPDDEETRKLRFAISEFEAYCRGVNRDISRDVVETVAKALRARMAADRAEREWYEWHQVSRDIWDGDIWWHDNGDQIFPVNIMWCPTGGCFFAAVGQWGWTRSQQLEEMGGLWMPCREPKQSGLAMKGGAE